MTAPNSSGSSLPGSATECRLCSRLAANLERVRTQYPHYHAAPVPSFGDPEARLLVAGLAPGMHGANATGRPFTGDHAGILLYRTLHRLGLSDRQESRSAADGLRLRDCRIANAVRCLPPENKPTPAEVRTCNPFLATEVRSLTRGSAILALGRIAHGAVLMAVGLPQSACTFAHGAAHELPGGLALIDSYHCSRYNTQTGRLTETMFLGAFGLAMGRLNGGHGRA
jgi:uracil-DNA glycosylase family 4